MTRNLLFCNIIHHLLSGDTSPHYGYKNGHKAGPQWDEVFSNMRFVVKTLENTFPETKIIPALGNHDAYPFDDFVDSKLDQNLTQFYSQYIDKAAFGDLFSKLDNGARDSFVNNCGFYVVKDDMYVRDGPIQTFIVLNTNLYYGNKDKVQKDDPCDQLSLLNATLANATSEENIFIVGHVPPGFFDLYPRNPFFDNENITTKMLDIVTKKEYADKIVAHFYGHTHVSSFRLFLDQTNRQIPRGIAFLAPSVTPRVNISL